MMCPIDRCIYNLIIIHLNLNTVLIIDNEKS